MKLYTCANCSNPVYFENNVCLVCGHALGFDIESLSIRSLALKPGGEYNDLKVAEKNYRYCANSSHGTCNWLVPLESPETLCLACSFNRTIPSLDKSENLKRWKKIENAKHRLIYSLLRLKLPLKPKAAEEDSGLYFDFLENLNEEARVLTGHANGTITLNIEEASEAERVRHKLDLGEKYRTLLGHFRHEIGHYYWELLIKDKPVIGAYRKIFGDERKDYGQALEQYYDSGAPENWNDHYISPYATAHSWEDWAETWSHYLHLMDTLETAYAFGTTIKPYKLKEQEEMQAEVRTDPYRSRDFEEIFKMWLPITFAFNSINRSMGHDDFYPFVISAVVKEKLNFIHNICAEIRFKNC